MNSAMQFTGRVLLVEDDEVSREVAIGMLEHLGAEVHAVTDGRSALDALEREQFDLVLMDVQMPTMDGIEAVRELRLREAQDKRPWTPVVALTANATADDRAACIEAGMDSYVAKPISLQTMTAVLASHLTTRR